VSNGHVQAVSSFHQTPPAVAGPVAARAARTVRVGLLGYGRVGQAVAATALAERERLAAAGLLLTCHHALVRDPAKPRGGPALGLYSDGSAIVNARVDVVVEALGGVEPARTLVLHALARGVPVVTANKTLVAHHGPALRAVARQHGVTLACEAAVLAGVPFLGSLARRPLVSMAERIAGIINGTSHFLLTEIGRGATLDAALMEAGRRGYAEPDSSADTSGRDAAEKLTILLHHAGCEDVRVADLTRQAIDGLTPDDLAAARRLGGVIKPVAVAVLNPEAPGAYVGPAFVADGHPFASLSGVDNALSLTLRPGHSVVFAGPGAGPSVTAATIVDDIVEAVSVAAASRELGRVPGRRIPPDALRAPAHGAWFLRIGDGPDRRVQITRPAPWSSIQAAVESARALGRPACAFPVI
jgi:homoserine dehydrogenase